MTARAPGGFCAAGRSQNEAPRHGREGEDPGERVAGSADHRFTRALHAPLYIAVAAVLTGMVPYDRINIDAPISDAFRQVGLGWAQFLISLGALAGIASCLLLMFSLPVENWLRLWVWLLVGFAVYFGYGRKRSVMARRACEAPSPPE